MKPDIDTYREIIDTLTRNKSRSFLTGFGVFWGVFMLIALIGGGNGLKEMLQNNFAGFATNSAMVWAQPTTKAYKGLSKGRQWTMVYKDVERLKQHIPEIDKACPLLFSRGDNAVFEDRSASCSVRGTTPDYSSIAEPQMLYGRYLNEMDMTHNRKVCVIGRRIYNDLFPGGGDPCGKAIRVNNIYYNVVGVDCSMRNINIGGRAERAIVLPITVVQKAYNRGNSVDIIAVTARPGVTMSSLTDRMREVVARAHSVDPSDEQGVAIFNTEVMFMMLDNLFNGVNFLIWLVGIGTLLAGAIGVSNIMMVTVRERTTEIGIRRAIGATPSNILSQILADSIVLTAVAGMSGILFAVTILQMLELGTTTDGITAARFQVDFHTAISAAALLTILGGMAGLAPAWRAMSIKPVDAMRDE